MSEPVIAVAPREIVGAAKLTVGALRVALENVPDDIVVAKFQDGDLHYCTAAKVEDLSKLRSDLKGTFLVVL